MKTAVLFLALCVTLSVGAGVITRARLEARSIYTASHYAIYNVLVQPVSVAARLVRYCYFIILSFLLQSCSG